MVTLTDRDDRHVIFNPAMVGIVDRAIHQEPGEEPYQLPGIVGVWTTTGIMAVKGSVNKVIAAFGDSLITLWREQQPVGLNPMWVIAVQQLMDGSTPVLGQTKIWTPFTPFSVDMNQGAVVDEINQWLARHQQGVDT